MSDGNSEPIVVVAVEDSSVLCSGVSSKLMSENNGVSENSGSSSNDGISSSLSLSMSKSVGIGNAFVVSTVSRIFSGCFGAGALNADVCSWPMLLRARIKAVRISAGISSDSSVVGSGCSGVGVCVSGSATGAGAGVEHRKLGILILGSFGVGTVISGFLFLITNVVVAM